MTAYEWFTAYLAATGSGHRGHMWQCPAHVDGSPSLSVKEGQDGVVLMHCFAGCALNDILDALGLHINLLFNPHPQRPETVLRNQLRRPTYPPMTSTSSSGGRGTKGDPIAVVHHVFVPDRVRLERRRYAGGGKTCRWEVRRGSHWEYAHDLDLSLLPLYEERLVRMAVAADEPIVLVESESSVDALLATGTYATTWAGGASNPPVGRLQDVLHGAKVIWVPDHDPAGLKCSTVIQEALSGVCRLTTIVPDPGCDARDLLAVHGPGSFMGDGRALAA